ncbi:hypothetical protein C8R47DRAFT_81832 [Mycena vitilis]|nr:hypothetical protein C8R47DRAFT_81832 [Mycena vitilis]
MASFPWKALKAETLRSVCKDLNAGGIKRTRDAMVAFLQNATASEFSWDSLRAATLRSMCRDVGGTAGDLRTSAAMIEFLRDVENRDATAETPEARTNRAVGPVSSITENADVANDETPAASTGASSADELAADMQYSMNFGDEPTCACQDGWLSPRTKFVLKVTAEVAQDLVRDTGEFAGEYGHVGATYLTDHIPAEYLPRGKAAAAKWVEAFEMVFEVIADMFDAGSIPHAYEVEQTLALPENKKKAQLFAAYTKWGGGAENALVALVEGAKHAWEEEEFEDTHGDEKWNALPTCTEHDFDWDLVTDGLVA